MAAATAQLAVGDPPRHAGDDRDEWLNLLLASRIEPHLGAPDPRSSTTIRQPGRPGHVVTTTAADGGRAI